LQLKLVLQRLESYKRLVSVSSRNFNVSSRPRLGWWRQRLGLVSVSGGKRLGLVSVSSFYVSCPSLSIFKFTDEANIPGGRSFEVSWGSVPKRSLDKTLV